jgi:predicted acetyltransferase
MSIEVRPYQSDDFSEVSAIRREAFRVPTDDDAWCRGGWVLADTGSIQAVALVERAGQFFGGRAVPCAQVRSVAVTPQARGRGWSRVLLSEILTTIGREGIVLSTLYPTAPAPYRSVGYEIAGSRTQYRWPVSLLTRSGAAPIEPLTDDGLRDVKECYRRFAAQSNGLLDRPEWWWRRLLAGSEDKSVLGCLVRGGTDVTGYMLYTQQPAQRPPAEASPSPLAALGMTFSIECRDLVWTDRESACALLGFAGRNGPLATDLLWSGPFPDPLIAFTPVQDAVAVRSTLLWMSRLVDVEGCLRARGYSPAVSGEIDLAVLDPVLPGNTRSIHIAWSDGQATVEQCRDARIRIHVGALATILTGWLGARDAARLGCLEGAGDRDVALLEAAFSGPPPWLPDVF